MLYLIIVFKFIYLFKCMIISIIVFQYNIVCCILIYLNILLIWLFYFILCIL